MFEPLAKRNNKVEPHRFSCQGSDYRYELGSIGFLEWLITLSTAPILPCQWVLLDVKIVC